jgi:hypothetical protein
MGIFEAVKKIEKFQKTEHPTDHEQETNFRLQNMKLPIGTTRRVRDILTELLKRLQGVLRNNPYIRDFMTACEILENELTHCRLVINASARPQEEHSRVYNKNLCEVAVLFNEEPGKRDLFYSYGKVAYKKLLTLIVLQIP